MVTLTTLVEGISMLKKMSDDMLIKESRDDMRMER